jgi:hypothetical protein
MNNLPSKKLPDPDFIGEVCQTFKKELKPTIYNLFQEIKAQEIFPNTFHKASTMFT